jgi:hypothetical protein
MLSKTSHLSKECIPQTHLDTSALGATQCLKYPGTTLCMMACMMAMRNPQKAHCSQPKKRHSPQQCVPQQRALLLPKHAQCQPNQQIPRVTKLLEYLIREGSRLCPPPQQGIAPEVEAPPWIWVLKIGPLLNCYIVLGRPHPKQGPPATMWWVLIGSPPPTQGPLETM